MPEISRILAALADRSSGPAALATLVQVAGSSYRRPGARLLLLQDGSRFGSISGGCLESDLVLRAQRVLSTGRAESVVYDTTEENDLVWGVGLGCQGVVRVLIEPVPAERPRWFQVLADNFTGRRETALAVVHDGPARLGTRLLDELEAGASPKTVFQETVEAPRSLVVFGAGDDAQPLVRMAKEIGWHVTVADSRPAYANRERFPLADVLVAAAASQLAEKTNLDARAFVIVMSHRYTEDLELLRTLLPQSLAYLGLLGPRKRTERLLAQLSTEGVALTASMRDRMHAPVGLDLGGSTPETVALAMLAEMQAQLAGRAPGFLRDRQGPIHG